MKSQQDIKRVKPYANQAYAQNLTDTFGEVNTSRERDETRSDQVAKQQKRLFIHKRNSSWNDNSPGSKRHGSRRASKRGSVLDNSFHLSVKHRGEANLSRKHPPDPLHGGTGKSTSRQSSRQQSKKELHKKGASSKPSNDDRRADGPNKVKAKPHTPPLLSDAHMKKVQSVDASRNPKPLKAKANVDAQQTESKDDILNQSLTATPTMDNLIPSAPPREEVITGQDSRIKEARRASMMNSIFRLNEMQRQQEKDKYPNKFQNAHVAGAGKQRGSKPIYLDGMDGMDADPYAEKSMSKHNKTHSGASSSMVTETSQSFVSQATGNRRTGLDMSMKRSAFASAHDRTNSFSQERGEEDEVE